MKFNSKAIVLGLGLASSAAFANDFNGEVGLVYADVEGLDVIQVTGTYYFDSVDLSNTAWAEAEFMGRNSNVSVQYTDFDSDVDAMGINLEFFGEGNNNLYGAIGFVSIDTPFGSDDVVVGELGYFVDDNWLVSIQATDDSDNPIFLKTKYVGDLGDGQFFNVEASIDDEENDLEVSADYYFTNASSFGLQLSQAEGFDYGLNFKHFFNKQFALEVTYASTDFGDETGIGITARF
ncbi:putative porin [Aliikangiella marina]|uniref:Putative porin n=1 Tax=Aliikangiella marina TaxID=1712262 RepID=A0A545TD75_9GAMM|nr:putative porin [Aliikangiella marina]TQV75174.1 putative porin [Aliikangiella marina]